MPTAKPPEFRRRALNLVATAALPAARRRPALPSSRRRGRVVARHRCFPSQVLTRFSEVLITAEIDIFLAIRFCFYRHNVAGVVVTVGWSTSH